MLSAESQVPPGILVLALEQAALLEQMELVHAPLRQPGAVMVLASASAVEQLSAPDTLEKEQVDESPLVVLLLEVAQVSVWLVAAVVQPLALEAQVPKLVLPG